MLITESYRQQNAKLHETNAAYGISGQKYARQVLELATMFKTTDILDYGCGKCTLAYNLPFPIKNFDPCILGLDTPPEQADIVVCTDTLEHVEEECVDEVLDHIKSLTRHAAFMEIATRPSIKSLPDGRNTHVTVRPGIWWMRKLEKRWAVEKSHVTEAHVMVFLKVKPKRDRKRTPKAAEVGGNQVGG